MKISQLASFLLFSCALATSHAQAPSHAGQNLPTPPPELTSFNAAAIDKSADPCSDFYQYACGNWIKNNPIPADQVRWGTFNILAERNRYLLWQELEAAAKAPKTPLEKLYGQFYAACMDTGLIEKKGLAPIKPMLDRIAALSDPKMLAELMGTLDASGAGGPLFDFYVVQDDKDSTKQIASLNQGGLSLPDRDYYLSDAPRYQQIRKQYAEHLTKVFTLAGDSPALATQEAAAVLTIETALAQASTSRTEMRDPASRYHIHTLAELNRLAPSFSFAAYFKAIPIRPFSSLNVGSPNFVKAIETQIQKQPTAAWRSYFRWHLIHSSASNLPQAFFNEDFAFFGKTLSGQQAPTPRWRQCTMLTDRALGETVGQNWVKKNFPPEAKSSMDKLVAALEKSLGDDIQTLGWMSDATKIAAQQKLALIRNKIGYPEKWRDYSALKVLPGDLIGNAWRANAFETAWNLGHLDKPVDEKEWGMTPPTVNAYYDPSMNDINFPAGILQPPFFDAKIDPAVNFGGIGVVIGHEITHGFDDEGSQYDGHGNLREWQTADDRKAFDERTQCIDDEYSSFVAAPAHDGQPEQKLNGKLTLGENTADNGGLRIAYMALLDTLKKQGSSIDAQIGGFTAKQRYFLGFAQVWCQNVTEQAARQYALVDPHAPGKWRVNGSVQNFNEFGKAFGCTPGQPMMPVKTCRVW